MGTTVLRPSPEAVAAGLATVLAVVPGTARSAIWRSRLAQRYSFKLELAASAEPLAAVAMGQTELTLGSTARRSLRRLLVQRPA